MNRHLCILLVILVAVVALAPAHAGWLLDAMKARREGIQKAPEEGDRDGIQGFDGRGSKKGRVALPAGARLEQDLGYGSDPAQKIDIYIPPGAKDAPVILMVHGGAWMTGDKANSGVVANKVTNWLPKGYVIASTNYRMSRAPNPLDQADDVGRALAFVQSKAPSWGADPYSVLLMGHSSGAHLVALLAADPSIATRQGASQWLGVVALDSAALNVVETMEAKHARFYDMVFGDDRSRWIEVSPFHRLKTASKPMLLVCSSKRKDSCPAARALAGRAESLGGRATVLPVDLNHGAVNMDLGRTNDYTASVEAFMRTLGLP